MRILLSILIIVMISTAASANAAPDRQTVYQRDIENLKKLRENLAVKFAASADALVRQAVIIEGRRAVIAALRDRILPPWLGTPWDYNGVSHRPGEGKIACGSFVVFTLQDAGFRIPSRMLRQPSENIIKNLTGQESIRRFANAKPMDKVIKHIRDQGDGLFMVGLDNHVGLLINTNGQIDFWHSTFMGPSPDVRRQDISEFSPLTFSRYRVIGKLLNDEMMLKWLQGNDFPVMHDYFKRRN